MLKTFALVMLFVSASLAYSISTLSNDTTSLGLLPQPLLPGMNPFALKYYKFWVPHNAREVEIDFKNLNPDNCYYLHIYLSNNLPCSPDIVSPSDNYFCDQIYDPGDGVTGNNTYTFNSDTLQDWFEWRVNSWAYIAIGRYSSSDNATCSFSLKTTVSVCDTNNIGFYAGDTLGSICVPYTNATAGSKITIPTISSAVTFFGLIQVPQNTGSLMGYINATTDSLVFTGASYGAPTANRYSCRTDSPSADPVATGYFNYVLDCPTPRAGEFYVMLMDESDTTETYSMTLSLTLQNCSAGKGGFNCTDNAMAWNATNSGKTVTVPANSYQYYYMDFTAGSGESVTLNIQPSLSSLFMVRPYGYPYDDSDSGYETGSQRTRMSANDNITRIITDADTINGGRWYWAIGNDNDTPLTFKMTAAATENTQNNNPGTQNTGGTQANPTGTNNVTPTQNEHSGSSSSGKGNAAASLVPSVFVGALFAFLLSLF
jgi:hypothetical protein